MTKCTWDCEVRNGTLRSGGGQSNKTYINAIRSCDPVRCHMTERSQINVE